MYEYPYPDPNLARNLDAMIDDYAEGTDEEIEESEQEVPPWVHDYEKD